MLKNRLKFNLNKRLFSSYLCSIDQGTSSTRFIIFNKNGNIIKLKQKEHKQYYPNRGYVEHNPNEIWENTLNVINETLKESNIQLKDIIGLGITNQRETTVVWNR